MRRLVWHTVTAWMLWRARTRLRKAVPALVALDTKRHKIARGHRSGARLIDAQRQALVTEQLMREMGRV